MRYFLLTIMIMLSAFGASAQGPNDMLIEITKDKARNASCELGLSEDQTALFVESFVREALSVEDIIVAGDPDIDLLKAVKEAADLKDSRIRQILDEDQYRIYMHWVDLEADREHSEFDSIQVALNDPEFRQATFEYYDINVGPYITYYHQAYFKPYLKQKYYWKINQDRAKLEVIRAALDSLDQAGITDDALHEELSGDFYNTIKDLKKIRKKYQDQLDYISVALGPVERQWTLDYIDLVGAHYPDEVNRKIRDYTYLQSAYGMHYLVGQLSLLLYDVYSPRSFVENRESISGMLNIF